MSPVGGDGVAGRRTGEPVAARSAGPPPEIPDPPSQAPVHAAAEAHEVSMGCGVLGVGLKPVIFLRTCFHIRRHAKNQAQGFAGPSPPIPTLPSTYSVHDFHSYGYHGTGKLYIGPPLLKWTLYLPRVHLRKPPVIIYNLKIRNESF